MRDGRRRCFLCVWTLSVICVECAQCSLGLASVLLSAWVLLFKIQAITGPGSGVAGRGAAMIQKNPADRRNAATRLAGQARMQRGVCSL